MEREARETYLSTADEEDGLAGHVGHGKGGSDLIVLIEEGRARRKRVSLHRARNFRQ